MDGETVNSLGGVAEAEVCWPASAQGLSQTCGAREKRGVRKGGDGGNQGGQQARDDWGHPQDVA